MILSTSFLGALGILAIVTTIGLPVFFISRFVFSRVGVQSKRRRNIFSLITAVVSLPLIYFAFVAILIISIFDNTYKPSPFYQEDWHEYPDTRYQMAEDIIERELLMGKSKAEVRAILGKDGRSFEKDHLNYYMGVPPGFIPDPESLNIYFKNGKVVTVTTSAWKP